MSDLSSPTGATSHKQSSLNLSYSVRRMRNTAVLVKWIEDHQSNPYPTKAEKQYLAYYSGMNLTQLSTWFANARRRIKKIGMKTWLEGRSTFSLDYFPSSLQSTARPSLGGADTYTGSAAYGGLSSTSPYAAAASYSSLTNSLQSTYQSPHQHTALLSGMGMGTAGTMTGHMTNGLGSYDTSTMPQHSSSSTSPLGSFYGMSASSHNRSAATMGLGMSSLSMGQWPTTPILSSNAVSFSSLQSRPSSDGSTGAPLHSPLTAQVYTADASLRTHSAQSIDVGDSTYSLQQHSPDQMLPECASTEPMLSDHKGTVTLQN